MYFDKMKQVRKEKGYSQQEIAAKIGIDQRQYSRYEQGKNELPIRYLKAFCEICEVSSDYIIELNPSKIES